MQDSKQAARTGNNHALAHARSWVQSRSSKRAIAVMQCMHACVLHTLCIEPDPDAAPETKLPIPRMASIPLQQKRLSHQPSIPLTEWHVAETGMDIGREVHRITLSHGNHWQ